MPRWRARNRAARQLGRLVASMKGPAAGEQQRAGRRQAAAGGELPHRPPALGKERRPCRGDGGAEGGELADRAGRRDRGGGSAAVLAVNRRADPLKRAEFREVDEWSGERQSGP